MNSNDFESNTGDTALFTNSNYFSYLQSILMMLISTAIFHNVCLSGSDFNMKVCGIAVIVCQLVAMYLSIVSFQYAWYRSEKTMSKKDKVTRLIIDSNLIILIGIIIAFNVNEMGLIFLGKHSRYE